MEQKRSKYPLFWRLLIWMIATLLVTLTLAMLVTLNYTLQTFQNKIDDALDSTVHTLSDMPSVRTALEEGVCSPELTNYLNSIITNTNDLDYITIADTDSIRIYHVDPTFIGKPFDGEDQYRALAGESYFSDASTTDFVDQHRAFHPVRNEEGEVIGFVMASATMRRISNLRHHVYWTYIRYFLLLSLLGLVLCGALAVYMGKNLRGVRPEDLLRVYLTQGDILNSLDEGLVSFDRRGRVRLVNTAAAKMLGHREELLLGRNVDDLLRQENGNSLQGLGPHTIQSNRPNVLVRVVPLPDSNLWARQVLILLDKSETMRYAEQLGGTQHMINALRANTHEFLNKLQVISGLLQMGYVTDAQEYIGGIAANYDQSIGPVMKLIREPNVSALILGKIGNMKELDIDFILMNNSALPQRSQYLTTEELVTVLGNLLENAMEAVNAVPAGYLRAVTLQVTEDDRGLLLMVSDTGEGISKENLPHIFRQGFSTKAQGRGTGMKLIKDIVDRHEGSIDIDTDPESGTTIAIIFNHRRGDFQ